MASNLKSQYLSSGRHITHICLTMRQMRWNTQLQGEFFGTYASRAQSKDALFFMRFWWVFFLTLLQIR